jgi:hypothetical protein
VCTENLIRFDLMTESLSVGRDDRADCPPLEPGRLALQAQEGSEVRLGARVCAENLDSSANALFPAPLLPTLARSAARSCRFSSLLALEIAESGRPAEDRRLVAL